MCRHGRNRFIPRHCFSKPTTLPPSSDASNKAFRVKLIYDLPVWHTCGLAWVKYMPCEGIPLLSPSPFSLFLLSLSHRTTKELIISTEFIRQHHKLQQTAPGTFECWTWNQTTCTVTVTGQRSNVNQFNQSWNKDPEVLLCHKFPNFLPVEGECLFLKFLGLRCIAVDSFHCSFERKERDTANYFFAGKGQCLIC